MLKCQYNYVELDTAGNILFQHYYTAFARCLKLVESLLRNVVLTQGTEFAKGLCNAFGLIKTCTHHGFKCCFYQHHLIMDPGWTLFILLVFSSK